MAVWVESIGCERWAQNPRAALREPLLALGAGRTHTTVVGEDGAPHQWGTDLCGEILARGEFRLPEPAWLADLAAGGSQRRRVENQSATMRRPTGRRQRQASEG